MKNYACILLCVLLSLLAPNGYAQTDPCDYYINTFAGDSVEGFFGDGGPATDAHLAWPGGIAMDSIGNIYFTDQANYRVRKITPAGIISTIAGNGLRGYSGDGGRAIFAEFSDQLWGIAVDHASNVYIADLDNYSIRKVNLAGVVTTIAGNGTQAICACGDGGPASAAELNEPQGVALDKFDNIYIVDIGSCVIRKIDTSGIINTIAGNQNCGDSGDGGPATAAAIFPSSLAVDLSGNIWIADQLNNKIRKITPDGIISTVAGNDVEGYYGDGGPATDAVLYWPTNIVSDANGYIYFCDYGNNAIRRITPAGIISTIAGTVNAGYSGDGGPATAAEIYHPWGLTMDGQGNIYFTDRSNNRLRMLTCADEGVTTVNHSGDVISLYPNPAYDELNIAVTSGFVGSNKIKEVAIANTYGQTLYNYTSGSEKVTLDISDLPPGVYFIKINGTVTRKFVKY